MKVIETALPGVLVIEPQVFPDARGHFMELWNERRFRAIGIDTPFVQDNLSRSVRHVVRGLHYQLRQPQAKLVRCIVGAIHDVVVDMRRSSPTFGRTLSTELSADNRRMLWVPVGFAHGFMTLSDVAEVFYKVSDFWSPEAERTVLWNDPELAIDWPACATPIVSAKDAAGLRFRDAESF